MAVTPLVRGVVELVFGHEKRRFRFGVQEVGELESHLGSDVKSHFLGNKGITNFNRFALFCGLLNTRRGITQPQVDEWYQHFIDNGGDEDDLAITLFEAIVDGKGVAGKDLVKVAERLRRIRAERSAIPEEGGAPLVEPAAPSDASGANETPISTS